jgi:hypothetical protein
MYIISGISTFVELRQPLFKGIGRLDASVLGKLEVGKTC